ncbi:STAS domain-containing protein, partial [Nocardiopsis salina]|uniref:STAS domain-containing protein n=1 Tax=Nocardiopsis salina TaxID=245836 RepID=UPI00037DDC1E
MTDRTAHTGPDRRAGRQAGPSPATELGRGPQLDTSAPSQTTVPHLRVSPVPVQGALVLKVCGEVDLANHEDFYRAISQRLAVQPARGCVVLDFSGLGFIDSSGVHALIRAHQEAAANQVRLRIAAPAPWVARLLRLT